MRCGPMCASCGTRPQKGHMIPKSNASRTSWRKKKNPATMRQASYRTLVLEGNLIQIHQVAKTQVLNPPATAPEAKKAKHNTMMSTCCLSKSALNQTGNHNHPLERLRRLFYNGETTTNPKESLQHRPAGHGFKHPLEKLPQSRRTQRRNHKHEHAATLTCVS